MKINKILLSVLFSVIMISSGVTHANVLHLTPADADWLGTSPKNPDADNIENITGFTEELYELYKQDVGGSESGNYALSYQTTYLNTPLDPQDALIEYISGSIADPLYLLVKDGVQHYPVWYIFDVASWNGTDDILLTGFWPEQGAISHISMYGQVGVPEPFTLVFLGVGLVGAAAFRKKFNK